jgi:hypothetical protein
MSTVLDRLTTALAGRYDVSKEIGAGGMATVYLGHDLKHDRDVAIKVLHPDLGAALGSERFLSEIKTTAKLQHPHILPLLDSGEADGLLYYVMPVVTGESLRVRIEREGQLSINESIRIAKEVASALDYAHRHGVVHRDIKPENILLHDGQAIVGDFGIALAITAAGGARMTQTGLSLGTPQYMSPEQAMGERTVDARSDIYSLGAVTYEMLTGDAPFTGNSVQAIVSKIMTQRPTPISAVRDTVPETVENAVAIALSKLPADRFATASEFATALTTPTTAFARTSGDIPRAGVGRRRVDTIAQRVGIPEIAIAIILGSVALWGWMRPQHPVAPVTRFEIALDSANYLAGNVGGSRVAVSPDGSIIAFAGGPVSQIFVRKRNELTTKPLPGTDGAIGPFFSQDGKQIGFTTPAYALRIVPVDGGAVTTIASGISRGEGSWGSDGLIYVTTTSKPGIFRVKPLAGAVPELISAPDPHDSTSYGFPSLLPGGKAILFNLLYRGEKVPSVAILDLSDRKSHTLFDGFVPQYITAGHIVYGANPGLAVVPFDLKSLKTTGDPVILSDPGGATLSPRDYAVSGAGTLVYGGRGANPATDLVWVDRAGNAKLVDSTWKGRFLYPALSPDGKLLAVGVSGQIWIKQLDHGPASQLTLGGRNNNYPAWTPDGKSVSFYTDLNDRHLNLWIKPADGSAQAAPLDKRFNPVESTWSPDGKWLVFRTTALLEGRGDIYATQPAGNAALLAIANSKFSEQSPSISPDGRWIAYSSDETGQDEIYVAPFPVTGGNKWPVSSSGGTEPVWAHNGRELFYRDHTGRLLSVEVKMAPTFSMGATKPLFQTREYAAWPSHRFYDVSRDDQRFIFVRPKVSFNASIVVVENWFEELKNLGKK